MKKTVITVIGIMGMFVTGYAGKVDILKPEYQRQEQELRRTMERLAAEGLKYKIIDERVTMTNKMSQPYITLAKTVQIPKDLDAQLAQYSQRFVLWNFDPYLDDPKYSFYAGILALRHARFRGLAYPGFPLPESAVKQGKRQWDKEWSPEMKDLLVFWNRLGGEQRYVKMKVKGFASPESYYGSILFEFMPSDYNRNIFAERIYKIDRDEPSPITPSGGEYGKFFDAFLKDGDKSVLKEITLAQPCVEHWIWLTLFGEEEKRLLSLEGLLAWSRINSPVENPFLSALAMGLFTVNGYAFNDETGVYTLNERGKMLMDFITEFPIPENATRLQAVMNGGNKDEIQAMMKKHGTGEKWAELLKNPVHPEFAKCPQD